MQAAADQAEQQLQAQLNGPSSGQDPGVRKCGEVWGWGGASVEQMCEIECTEGVKEYD